MGTVTFSSGFFAATSSFASTVVKTVKRVIRAYRNYQTVSKLSCLDERTLSDIGLSSRDVAAASVSPFGSAVTELNCVSRTRQRAQLARKQ